MGGTQVGLTVPSGGRVGSAVRVAMIAVSRGRGVRDGRGSGRVGEGVLVGSEGKPGVPVRGQSVSVTRGRGSGVRLGRGHIGVAVRVGRCARGVAVGVAVPVGEALALSVAEGVALAFGGAPVVGVFVGATDAVGVVVAVGVSGAAAGGLAVGVSVAASGVGDGPGPAGGREPEAGGADCTRPAMVMACSAAACRALATSGSGAIRANSARAPAWATTRETTLSRSAGSRLGATFAAASSPVSRAFSAVVSA
jgi:hypothetical protein